METNLTSIRLDICSQRPYTYDEATEIFTLGHAENMSINKVDGTVIFSDEEYRILVTKTGDATYWAVTDTNTCRLIDTGWMSDAMEIYQGLDTIFAA